MIDNDQKAVIIRAYDKEDHNRAWKFCKDNNIKIIDSYWYFTYDFGQIVTDDAEGIALFKFCFEGNYVMFDPDGQDPDSVGAIRDGLHNRSSKRILL